MTEVFSSSDYALVYPPGIEKHFWNAARNQLVLRWLRPLVSDDTLVMDVGCGPGIFVEYARNQGLNIRGVELGRPALKPGVEPYVDTGANLFDLDAETRQRVRVVLLLDVLEHMADRQAFISQLAEQLPNCRHLLITVPARMELWSGYDEHWGHHLRYDRPRLRKELAESPFEPGSTRYFFHWVYLASYLMKRLGIQRKNEYQSPDRTRLGAWLHKLLAVVSNLEARIVPGTVAGSSIVCVAQRRAP